MEDFRQQFISALLGYAVQRDTDPKRLCELSGISFKALQQKDATPLDGAQVNSLWKNAAHLTGDKMFGLHFGESMQLAALGVMGQILLSSNNAGDALNTAGALLPLITDMFRMHLTHGKKTFTIHYVADPALAAKYPYTYRHMADYLLVFTLHELKGLLFRKLEPVAVTFPEAVTDQYEYTRVLKGPVKKKTGELTIEMEAALLQEPILSANYDLHNVLLQKVNALMTGMENNGTMQTKIYHYLLANSYLYTISLEAVAANFNISPRSLQRKLKDEGVTFLQIVEAVRKSLAMNYLESGHHQIKDIAGILGYNEPSAFLKAFKRWTGKTPADFRNKLNG